METLSFLTGHPTNIVVTFGVVALVMLQVLNRNRSENMRQSRDLIDTLEARIQSMQNELTDLRNLETTRAAEMELLKSRNKFLEDLFLQRGTDDTEYRKRAVESMKMIESIHQYLTDNQKAPRQRRAI